MYFADIDAKFSKISMALKRHDAKTVIELVEVIKNSTSSSMLPELLTTVFNIRDWLSPYIEEIHNHRFPHVYRYVIERHMCCIIITLTRGV